MWLTSNIPNIQLTTPKRLICKTKVEFLDVLNEDTNSYNEEIVLPPLAASQSLPFTARLEKRAGNRTGKEYFSVILTPCDISPGNEWSYFSGDTIGILPENRIECVDFVLNRCGVFEEKDKLLLLSSSKPYYPKCTTYSQLTTKYINITGIPKKQLLASLADYCNNLNESKRLQFLSSKEGSNAYNDFILEKGVNFFEIISSLPSLCPPITLLLDHLPRLLPRPYSIASSRYKDPLALRILFSVLPPAVEGLCTGMIRRGLLDTGQINLQVFLRESNGFRFPDDPKIPLILIGPGTAIAPFMGLLEERKALQTNGVIYLLTSFRFKSDFIFQTEIEEYLESRVLYHFTATYSQENEAGNSYVQDSVRKEWKNLGEILCNQHGRLFSCGDAKGMHLNIEEAITEVIKQFKDLSQESAKEFVEKMKIEKRYIHDAWF